MKRLGICNPWLVEWSKCFIKSISKLIHYCVCVLYVTDVCYVSIGISWVLCLKRTEELCIRDCSCTIYILNHRLHKLIYTDSGCQINYHILLSTTQKCLRNQWKVWVLEGNFEGKY